MKILIVATICIAMTTTVFAEDDWYARCESLASLAEVVMRNRQDGVAMSKMMKNTPKTIFKSVIESLIITAYDTPRFSTKKMQQRATEDFRDEIYLECIKQSRGKK